MPKTYKVIRFICDENLTDILIAELSLIGYDSFLMKEMGFEASILSKNYNQQSIEAIISDLQIQTEIQYSVEEIWDINWNREWEKYYDPIVVEEYCRIKASFHKDTGIYPLEITINPKMSFGTGHHDSTYLMVQHLIQIDQKNKRVLDVGCGTGILSILAEKLGADEVLGIDIDHWAYENSKENIKANNCQKIRVLEISIQDLTGQGLFDIILANINTNVILKEMALYRHFLKKKGMLIISGFLTKDYKRINTQAIQKGFKFWLKRTRNNWLSLIYVTHTN